MSATLADILSSDQFFNCLQKLFKISALCAHTGMQMLSPFIDSSVDKVLLQTSTSRFEFDITKRCLIDSLLHDTANGLRSALLEATDPEK